MSTAVTEPEPVDGGAGGGVGGPGDGRGGGGEVFGVPHEQILAAARFLERRGRSGMVELAELLPTQGDHHEASRPLDELERDRVAVIRFDAASAYRDAAQWYTMVDLERARSALGRAGSLFSELGQPYGLYLDRVSGHWDRRHVAAATDGLRVLRMVESGERVLDRSAAALAHPQQQAYLVLTLASMVPDDTTMSEDFSSALTQSPHARGSVPVGALGIPIRRLWAVAEQLAHGRDADLGVIAAHLDVVAQLYAEAIESAMVNEHLWYNAASPVDLGDLDIVGMASLTARVVGRARALEMRDLVRSGGEARDVVQDLMTVGVELGSPQGRPRVDGIHDHG